MLSFCNLPPPAIPTNKGGPISLRSFGLSDSSAQQRGKLVIIANMADFVKPEPDAQGASPGAFSEEDIYEDAGDLEFNTEQKNMGAYLAKVPRYVWEAWSKLDEDQEIRIGTVRQYKQQDPRTGEVKTTSLGILLAKDVPQHQTIPKEYFLDIMDYNVTNTFAFTEQDLPGFKSKSRAKFDLTSANMPSRLTRPKTEKPQFKKPYDPNKKFEPYYRKAIPKRTTLAARIAHEVNVIAVSTPESDRLIAEMTMEAMKPKAQVSFVKDINDETGLIQPGTLNAQSRFSNFIKLKNPKTSSGKPQTIKTARMPENELLDRLFALFRQYKYWPMKSIRQKLQQPEVYLKEILPKIAVLQKSGSFSNLWTLKPENRPENYGEMTDEAAAPNAVGEDSDMMDEDDDDDMDVKFEDVA